LQPEAFKFIFKISPDVKTLIIDGMNFYNRNSVPLTRIKATVTTFIDEYEDPPSGTSATSRVHITNCTLVNCRIGVYYSHDNCDILIKNNHILSEWTPSDYKSWLRTRTTNPNTYTNNILDPRYFGVRIIDNVLDVACCSGHNRDLAKIGGQGQYTLVQGNLFKNSNPESQAEVDMFTGGYQIRFISNQLINASLKVHTGGNLENLPEHHIGEVKYVLVNDNQFIFEQGSAQNWGIVFRTIFGIISNNIIKRNGAENDHNFTGLVISGLKDAPNEFDGTSTPGALIVSDNLFDMRYEPGSGPQVGCVIKDTILYPMFSSNMVIGGDEMNIEGFTYIDP
jgi:hypothetical protein